MEGVKYFLTDNREVGEEELNSLISAFHQQNPNLPFEYIKKWEDGASCKAQKFSSIEACFKWEVEQHLMVKANKYREEGRCYCGALNCRYKNKFPHR
jgi:hypothetical protein